MNGREIDKLCYSRNEQKNRNSIAGSNQKASNGRLYRDIL